MLRLVASRKAPGYLLFAVGIVESPEIGYSYCNQTRRPKHDEVLLYSHMGKCWFLSLSNPIYHQ